MSKNVNGGRNISTINGYGRKAVTYIIPGRLNVATRIGKGDMDNRDVDLKKRGEGMDRIYGMRCIRCRVNEITRPLHVYCDVCVKETEL